MMELIFFFLGSFVGAVCAFAIGLRVALDRPDFARSYLRGFTCYGQTTNGRSERIRK